MVRRKILSLLLLLCLLIHAAPAHSQVSSSQIDAVFPASLKSNKSPGAAALVVYNGRTVFRRGYGVTDLRTLQLIDERTNFRLASFTKQFTAACIMLLVRDGKLHYDDHLTDFFPEFPAYGKTITVRNLLNHTSGLEDYEELLLKQSPDTPPEKIPQIHDAGVLKLLEQQTSGEVSARHEMGVQQFRLRRAGDDRRKSFRQALRPIPAGENLHAAENEKHAGLREGQERSAAPRLRPHERATAGTKPTRAQPPPFSATVASTRRSMIWRSGIVPCAFTLCSPKPRCSPHSLQCSPQTVREDFPTAQP